MTTLQGSNTCQYPECTAPLGGDSQMAGYLTCHTHRVCRFCLEPISSSEVRLAFTRAEEDGREVGYSDLYHTRCYAKENPPVPLVSSDPEATTIIKQSELDFLNILRLMVIPDSDLSVTTNENNAMIQNKRLVENMSLDDAMLHLRMMEASVAACSIYIRTHPKFRKEALSEREKKHSAKAKTEALTSSRPAGVKSDDSEEIALGTFMEMFGLKERTSAKAIYRDRNKAIQGLMKTNGMPEPMARDIVTQMLQVKGVLGNKVVSPISPVSKPEVKS